MIINSLNTAVFGSFYPKLKFSSKASAAQDYRISPNYSLLLEPHPAIPPLLSLPDMERVTLSQMSASDPEPAVKVQQFTALELKVDALAAQLHLLLPSPSAKGKGSRNGLKPNQSPRIPSFNVPLTPDSLPGTPDVGLQGSPAILDQDYSIAVTEKHSAKLALQILDIIQRYGNNVASSDASWPGKTKFLPLVEVCVVKREPVRMVSPAFPFKSPKRRDKTLGSLPDLGEELALMHLNGLCESIAEVYEQGAKVIIASDGLVYNGKFKIPSQNM